MIWIFERGKQIARVEMIVLGPDAYELRVLDADGKEHVEHYTTAERPGRVNSSGRTRSRPTGGRRRAPGSCRVEWKRHERASGEDLANRRGYLRGDFRDRSDAAAAVSVHTPRGFQRQPCQPHRGQAYRRTGSSHLMKRKSPCVCRRTNSVSQPCRRQLGTGRIRNDVSAISAVDPCAAS